MKNRWIGGLLVAAVLSLAACAPPTQGGGASGEASGAAAPRSSEPMESERPVRSTDPGGYDYDY